jgi:hypothetical protein
VEIHVVTGLLPLFSILQHRQRVAVLSFLVKHFSMMLMTPEEKKMMKMAIKMVHPIAMPTL